MLAEFGWGLASMRWSLWAVIHLIPWPVAVGIFLVGRGRKWLLVQACVRVNGHMARIRPPKPEVVGYREVFMRLVCSEGLYPLRMPLWMVT
jgi:hypothetical protein